MDKLSSFVVAICLLVTPFLLFGAVSSIAFFQTIHPKTIDQTMEQRGVYSAIVPALISTATYTNQQNEATRLPLNEKWVVDSANTAFPPENIRSATNTIVDASFRWLNGETETPKFAINLQENKQKLADIVGIYITERSKALPICTQEQLFELAGNLNVYSAPCRPAFVSPETAGQTARAEILNDQAIIPNATLTPDNLKANTGTDPFAELKNVRALFSNQQLLVWVLCLLALAMVGLSILLTPNKIHALKRAGIILITGAVGLAVFGLTIGFVAKQALNIGIDDKLASTVLLPTIDGLIAHAQKFYYIGATIITGISILVFIIYYFARQRTSS